MTAPPQSRGSEAQADSPADLARRAALGDFSPDVLAWIQDGCRRLVIEGEPIENALRLDRASRMRERNKALRRAAAMLALGCDDAWPIALRLKHAVARYERKRDAPSTPLEVELAAAFSHGLGVPTTQRMLYEIIR